jgi:polyferredoxin
MVIKMGKNRLRIIPEIIFLALFALIIIRNFMIIWLFVFVTGIVASLFFERLYCGWVCPINTLFRPINWIFSKLGVKRRKPPKLLMNNWPKLIIVLVFLLTLIATRVLGLNIPIFLYFLVFGVAVTLFFEERLFHGYLCPYGTILEQSSKVAYYGISIREDTCTGCGSCEDVCPNDSLVAMSSGVRSVVKNKCLLCFRCQEVCAADAVGYRKLKG